MMKIIFAGTPEFAKVALAAVLDSKAYQQGQYQIVAVYTQPDRPAGRGRRLTASAVKQLAQQHQLPVYQPISLKDEVVQKTLASHQADLMIVAAYGLILPQIVLDTPKLGCINIHASLLPRWRGAAPIQRAILAGDRETGITIMQMDQGLDTGDICSIHPCEIHENDSAQILHDRLALCGAKAVLNALKALSAQKITRTPQDDQNATYAQKLVKQEAQLDWHQPIELMLRQIRAFNPYPVAFFDWRGERIRVFEGRQYSMTSQGQCGEVICADTGEVLVCASNGMIELLEIQFAGGRRLKGVSMWQKVNALISVYNPQ